MNALSDTQGSASKSIALLPKCGHLFHTQCLSTWFQKAKTCPTCREVAVAKQLIHPRLEFSVLIAQEGEYQEDSTQNIAIITELYSQVSELKSQLNTALQTQAEIIENATKAHVECSEFQNLKSTFSKF